MSRPNTPQFETPESVAAYAHKRLLTILSRLAFSHIDEAKALAAQLTTEMANVRNRAAMTPAQDDPNRYDLAALPERATFDE